MPNIVRNDQSHTLKTQRYNEIESNPLYSLEVDPENKYEMPEDQKEFIRQMIQFRSIPIAAELAGIEQDIARQYYLKYDTQCELKRLNLAIYQRQFSNRLLTLNEIGGYLTSMLTDVNVPVSSQLKSVDKLKVIQLLMELNKMNIEANQTSASIKVNDIDLQIKNLSISAIQELLKQNEQENQQTVDKSDYNVSEEGLTEDETEFLRSLSTEEILNLLNETTNKEVENVEQTADKNDRNN